MTVPLIGSAGERASSRASSALYVAAAFRKNAASSAVLATTPPKLPLGATKNSTACRSRANRNFQSRQLLIASIGRATTWKSKRQKHCCYKTGNQTLLSESVRGKTVGRSSALATTGYVFCYLRNDYPFGIHPSNAVRFNPFAVWS